MDINIDTISILGGEVDKSQVPPIDQKRIIAFVNHFILNTCTCLNNFALKCEVRFIEIERKLQKIQASLIIIEEKLSSIPGLEDQPKLTQNISEIKDEEPAANTKIVEVTKSESEAECTQIVKDPIDSKDESNKGVEACLDIRYKKYFKMVQFGVPPAAVKLKMKSEGLVPEVLDTPKLILQDGISSEETVS